MPAPGDYTVRVLPSPDAKAAEELPYSFGDQKTSITIDTSRLGKSPRIAVDDGRTGNTAVVPLPAGDTLQLHNSDFDHVRRVDVLVTYKDKPLKTAQVTFTTADKATQTKTLTAQDAGRAVFYDVPAGPTHITVAYGEKLSTTQDIPITSDHPAGIVTVNVPVSTAAPTVETAPPAGAQPVAPAAGAAPAVAPPTAPPAPTGGSPLAELLNMIVGIAIVGGVGYLLYRWYLSGGAAATLKKAGIEVSGPTTPSDAGTPWQPNAPAPPVVADPSLCQFCGQKKDAAGNCACTVGGAGATGAVVGAPQVASEPRLVGTVGAYSGTIFPLHVNGSAVTVGRDAANTIPLTNDTTVSRRHASVRDDGGTYSVVDEGSSNGVYVNGVRINGSQALKPGDEVQIGNTRFRFEA